MAKTREQAQAAREAKLDELHESLTGAVEELVSGPDWARALTFAARFRSRSFNNTLLIWVAHAEAYEQGRVPEPFPSYVAGYKQWQALGRQVEKGQPGYQILAPVTGRFASATPQDAESWRRLGKGEKPRAGEVVRSKMVGVRPTYVWDASQTAGDPIPEPPAPRVLEGEVPAGLWGGLAAQVEAAGFAVLRVPHEGMIHGANGMTDYTANTVAVRENMDPAAQVKTLAHELGHVLLHGPDAEDVRQHRGIGEVEAESVALMVGAAHGMDTSGYTIPYVSTWATRVDGTEPVITRLERDTAETFALGKILEMARVDGSPVAELRVAGVASDVASVMPLWFWKVLAAVWRVAKDDGRLPTVLLVSQESLVPWELATTNEDFIVDRTLVDEAAPQILGAQAIVGRWRPAGPETPSGIRRPNTTPAETMAIKSLAVVIGEFNASSGMKSLKEAIEEGRQLTDTYPSVWVKATAEDVATLLKGQFTDRGAVIDVQVLHVASHGEVDPQSPINTGVILSNSSVRIDETIVVGSPFTKTAAPLVFLNCCQLATEAGGALVEGGLAAAFLRAGARAFIAPLWNVNDGIAKDTALAFYAETIGKGRPVGDVMRELRARFATFPKRDQTTPLAYAYYGHPGLILTRQETH